jgi:hypothetical protein
MASYTVQQGDCVSSLALRFGLKTWQELWDANGALHDTRPNPNVLLPGDVLVVPDGPEQWMDCATGRSHRFVVELPTVKLRIFLKNEDGTPQEGKRFLLTVGKREIESETQAEGLLEADVPADARSAHLLVWLDEDDISDIDCDLAIGGLDPVDAISGMQARLDNLGFRCPRGGKLDDATRAAMSAFRERHDLAEPDEPEQPGAIARDFLDKLCSEHDRS